MGKGLKGKSLGVSICQRKDGLYYGRFVSKRTGISVEKYFKKLQDCRQWYADARINDEHGGIDASGDIGNMLLSDVKPMHCQNVLNQMKDDYKSFLLQTGLRTGEMIALKWSDIDFKKKVVHIQRSMEFNDYVFLCRKGEPT